MPLFLSIISGLLWGILGSLATLQSFGHRAWFASLAGPIIGLLIYRLSRRFYRKSLWAIAHVTVWSTILSVAMFGFTLGLIDLSRNTPNTISWAVVVQAINACLWGLFFIPIYWLLFPISFANHALIRRFARHSDQQESH